MQIVGFCFKMRHALVDACFDFRSLFFFGEENAFRPEDMG